MRPALTVINGVLMSRICNTAEKEELFKQWVAHLHEVTGQFYVEFVHDVEDNGDFCGAIRHNNHCLMLALRKALDDLCTYVERHMGEDEKMPDRHKYAGFIAKWIAKIRPFYVDYDGDGELPEHLLRVNAYYAAYIFRSLLEINGSISPHLLEIALHAFDFRDEQGENLSFMAYTWEMVANEAARDAHCIPVV